MNVRHLKFELSPFAFLIILTSHALAAAEAPWVGHTLKGNPCSGGIQGYGPYDYTNPIHRETKLERVEGAHFHNRIKQLTGLPDRVLFSDIDYTIRAFPNHHLALQSMMRLQIRSKIPSKTVGTPIECYFERAINFNPNDGVPRLLYGVYAQKLGKHSIALQQYKLADKLLPNNSELHYNLALLYIDLKEYGQARKSAITAYKNGYPLMGLKNKLKKLGYWKTSAD